jgi:hypothetical protein
MVDTLDMQQTSPLLNDYDTIETWRSTLKEGETVKLPRLVDGLPYEYFELWDERAILFDAIEITREHLDRMTNREVIAYIQSQTHTCH